MAISLKLKKVVLEAHSKITLEENTFNNVYFLHLKNVFQSRIVQTDIAPMMISDTLNFKTERLNNEDWILF